MQAAEQYDAVVIGAGQAGTPLARAGSVWSHTCAELLGLAAITLALGIAYWLMRERDDRRLLDSPEQSV